MLYCEIGNNYNELAYCRNNFDSIIVEVMIRN